MNQQLEKRTQTAVALRNLVDQPQYKSRFSELLKERAPQFVASLVQLVNASEQLQRCEPNSVIASAITAAALDLPIEKNLGFAWIVPYGTQAQFQMGYRGYVQLAIRTGLYKFINVTEVYEGELDVHNRMTSEVTLRQDKKISDKIIGYAAYFKLVSGYEHAEYWDVDTVRTHAQRFSQSYRKDGDTPWKSDFDAMAMKTVLKSLISHWGPMSVEMRRAVVHDMGVQATIEADVTFPDNVDEVKQPTFPGKPAALPEPKTPETPPTKPVEPKATGRGRQQVKTAAPEPPPQPRVEPRPADPIPEPTPLQEEPESGMEVFETPPEPEPIVEAPVTGQPPQPPAATEPQELIPLRAAMRNQGVTEHQVVQFCQKAKLLQADKGEHHLSQLTPVKIGRLTEAINKVTSPILTQIKEFPPA